MTTPEPGRWSASAGTVALECVRCGAGLDVVGGDTTVFCTACLTALDCCRCEHCRAGSLVPATTMVKSVMCSHCGASLAVGTWRAHRIAAHAVRSSLPSDGVGADIDRRRLTGTTVAATGMAWLIGGATCSLVFGPDTVQVLTDASMGAREVDTIDYATVDELDCSAVGPTVHTMDTVVHLRAGEREIYLRTDAFEPAALDRLLQPVRIRINAARRRPRPPALAPAQTSPVPPPPRQTPPVPPPRPLDTASATVPAWPVRASANTVSPSAKLWAILAVGAVVVIAIVLTVLVTNRDTRSTPAGPATSYPGASGYPAVSATDMPSAGPWGSAPATTPRIPPPPVTLPDAYHQNCPDGFSLPNRTGFGTHAYRGSVETSCQFTSNVLRSYWDQFSTATPQTRSVIAPGTVRCSTTGGQCSGDDFIMQCGVEAHNDYITCRGGRNAVVFLY